MGTALCKHRLYYQSVAESAFRSQRNTCKRRRRVSSSLPCAVLAAEGEDTLVHLLQLALCLAVLTTPSLYLYCATWRLLSALPLCSLLAGGCRQTQLTYPSLKGSTRNCCPRSSAVESCLCWRAHQLPTSCESWYSSSTLSASPRPPQRWLTSP